MSRIRLLVSDVDGTLVTPDKQLTGATLDAVRRLRRQDIAFTITSSRPPFGMRLLVDPLGLDLPLGPYNGSSVVAPDMRIIERHTLPADAVRQALDILRAFDADIWLFTDDAWLIARDDGKYVPHEQRTIKFAPTQVSDFGPHLDSVCKMVGASADAEGLIRCEHALQHALGSTALAHRSQTYYVDITPPGFDKGTFTRSIAARLGIPLSQVAVIGDMQNDVAMFEVAGLSFAMGNAPDDVKSRAIHVTRANTEDGFAAAVDVILSQAD